MAFLTVADVSFCYPHATQDTLSSLSFEMEEGEFLLLCGPSGCGKTTLLRHLKPALTPYGRRKGQILFDGVPLDTLPERRAAGEIGYVFQNPDNQLVTDTVLRELAFGLENLNVSRNEMRLRIAEMAEWFNVTPLLKRKTDSLSGGQKQLVNLAAIMAMRPRLLLLDEPTSQLDPAAAADFLTLLQRLNRELGVAVLLSEHRTEELFPLADRILLMENGGIRSAVSPQQTASLLRHAGDEPSLLLPMPARVALCTAKPEDELPLTIREGQAYLANLLLKKLPPLSDSPVLPEAAPLLTAKSISFRYQKEDPDVLHRTSLSLLCGGLTTLLGGNGSGKTTLLRLLAGNLPPVSGKIQLLGKKRPALLPQNPQALFVCDQAIDELYEVLPKERRHPEDEAVSRLIGQLALKPLLSRHPYDLSGGEQQLLALAKLLLCEPDILLLDEPAKGLDPYAKRELGLLLRQLASEGRAILAVTHDTEWAAEFSSRCLLLFEGEIAAEGTPREFFSAMYYTTTAGRRLTRKLCDNAVTFEDVIKLCRKAD